MDASLRWHDEDWRLAPLLLLGQSRRMRKGDWVYIRTNAPYGTLHIGVTADLAARVVQHRAGEGSDFCRRYGLTRLVYCEFFERIEDAIAREKAMKAWKREWKVRQIEQLNPTWKDLFDQLLEASF